MIDPKSLRIGNYIVSKVTNQHVQVDDEHISYIAKNHQLFSGIPLSENELIRLGFWKIEGSNVWLNAAGNYRYCIHQTGMQQPFDIRSNDKSSYFISTPGEVHTLQNAWNSLTGEELTYKVGLTTPTESETPVIGSNGIINTGEDNRI